jgi:hypothetical protein
MIEVGAMLGVAGVGALWKIAVEHGSVKGTLTGILKELTEIKDGVEKRLDDHECRIRMLEGSDISRRR